MALRLPAASNAAALITCEVPTLIGAVNCVDAAVGSAGTVVPVPTVYRITAPASVSAMLTDCAVAYVPVAGFTVGAGGGVVSTGVVPPVAMVRVSCGRLAAVAFSREAKSRPSMTSPNSWKDTSPAAVMPETGVLTRPIAMLPKLPTVAVPVRAGWVFQVAVSLQVVPVRQIAGPLVVALDTWTPRLAAVIDSPAARAGTVNFR